MVFVMFETLALLVENLSCFRRKPAWCVIYAVPITINPFLSCLASEHMPVSVQLMAADCTRIAQNRGIPCTAHSLANHPRTKTEQQ